MKMVWKRLSEVYDISKFNIISLPKEFKDNKNILFNDIIQGELGDCYFISVLSSFAEFPERVMTFF